MAVAYDGFKRIAVVVTVPSTDGRPRRPSHSAGDAGDLPHLGYCNMGRGETLGFIETGVYADPDEWRPPSISISRGALAFVHKH